MTRTYDFDGQLVSTPDVDGAGLQDAVSYDRTLLGLKEVRCERWLDYVLVNLDDNAAPLPDHLAPLDAFLSRVDLSVLRHGGSWEYTYPGNWKVAVEGGI